MLWVVADRFSGTPVRSPELLPGRFWFSSHASLFTGSLNPHSFLCFRVSSAVSETDISSSLPFNLASKGELWSCCVDSS